MTTCIVKLNETFFTLFHLTTERKKISQRCLANLTLKYSTYLSRDASTKFDTLVSVYSSRPLRNASWVHGAKWGGNGKRRPTHIKGGKYNVTMKQP